MIGCEGSPILTSRNLKKLTRKLLDVFTNCDELFPCDIETNDIFQVHDVYTLCVIETRAWMEAKTRRQTVFYDEKLLISFQLIVAGM